VTYGAHPADSLSALSPKYMASSISALSGWLKDNA
jgi:phosphoglycolate phosphatase